MHYQASSSTEQGQRAITHYAAPGSHISYHNKVQGGLYFLTKKIFLHFRTAMLAMQYREKKHSGEKYNSNRKVIEQAKEEGIECIHGRLILN